MAKYRIVAVCGPFGAPLQKFATQLACDLSATLINAEEYEQFNEVESTWNVDDEQLLNRLKENKSLVIVYGHFLFTNKKIGEQIDVKLFMEQDSDSCIATILNEHQQQLSKEPLLLDALCNHYNAYQKPANENYINVSKKHADIIIPAKNGYSIPIQSFLSSLRVQDEQQSIQSSKNALFFKSQEQKKESSTESAVKPTFFN